MLGMELMKLYKDEKVNPMGSCGLLLIQMPILIVIYHVIIGIQNPANSYYLYSMLSDYNMLSISANFYGVDLFGIG
jgi:membrane protein insertase Oxa1/YidC/SpoIIIJ